jgi:hypothetical protein
VKLVETQWWALPIDQEWLTEVDEDTVIISDEDGIGSLEISVLEWDDGEVVAEDLQVLSQQLIPAGVKGQAVACGQWQGQYFSYVDHEDACRDWLLLGGQKVMLISYTCDPEHQGMDDAAVDQMLAGLQRRAG